MTPKNPVVETVSGRVEGSYHDGLYVFKGIPYAAPPVGERRWLPPRPVAPWRGVRPAKGFGMIAPQNPPPGGGDLMSFQGDYPQDEDCLYLNIWSPGLDEARRPVMVWIHGGAFSAGSGSEPVYWGSHLARRGGAVIVTINYRLGGLGFLNLNEVTRGRIPATGNEGLLDQIAALGWVRDNIAAFGGDPGNVTIFGESAGGMSIGCLMAMPAARGLFHKAILESGVGSTAVSLGEAVKVAESFLGVLGLSGRDAKALRALTVDEILAADAGLRANAAVSMEVMRLMVLVPVIDGKVIPVVPLEAIRQGSAKDIPVIIGTNLDEWKLFGAAQPDMAIDEAGVVRHLSNFLPEEPAKGLVAAYRRARARRGASTRPSELLSAILTDLKFRMPALSVVEAQQHYAPAYSYLFNWVSPVMRGALGACHILEVGFVFGRYDDRFCGSGPDADRLSGTIQDAWLAFARSGDPSGESPGRWPPYGSRRLTMMLGRDCHVEAAPYEDERRAWGLIPNEF
jgi:para-nitrobenzyl esterase